MKLDKISANGFKSFADKTEFDFGEGITCIVGPNGCGKSNVVDALKWVLGDQSPKSLRSGQMADVIFSGSSSRKASGMAEVSLFFSDVNKPGLENEELVITRRLYRSGESDYLINNKSCRLRDIKEMFMDTGVGVRAYSIIEQGQIDQLLHASKTDRRLIFEEAAGISKFKAHKKEALRKLERTEQNLLRLADIVNEIQKQLRSVKLQAGKARNYLEYTEQLKNLQVNYSLSEYDRLVTETAKKVQKLGALEDKFAQTSAAVSQSDNELSRVNSDIMDTEASINKADNMLVASRSRIEQQLERIEMLKERLKELSEMKITANGRIRSLHEQVVEFERGLDEAKSDLENSETELDSKKEELDILESEIHSIKDKCSKLEAELEDEKSGVIDCVRRTAQLHNEIESMNTYRNNLSGQKDKLHGKADEAGRQLEGLVREKAGHQAKLKEIESVLEELGSSLDQKRSELLEVDQETAKAHEELAEAKEHRSALSSEKNVLADMESKRQGLNADIREILKEKKNDKDRFPYISGIAADIFSADLDNAAALEAALEGLTDALVINDTRAFLQDGELREKLQSRIKIICGDKVGSFYDSLDLTKENKVKCRVVELADYEAQFAPLAWSLLGKTLVVDTLEDAVELSGRLGKGYRFVTRQGQSYDGREMMKAGPLGKNAGLISRKSRISQLEHELAKASVAINGINERLENQNRKSGHLENLCKELRTAIYEANTEKVDEQGKIRLLEQSISKLKEEQPVIAGEIEMLEQEISESVEREYESRKKLEETEAISSQRQENIDVLESRLQEHRSELNEKSSSGTNLKVRIGQLNEQCASNRQKISSINSQLQQHRVSINNARSELSTSDQQISTANRNILAAESRVSELYVEKDQAQIESRKLHEKLTDILESRSVLENDLKNNKSRQKELEENIHKIQLDLNSLKVKTEDLIQRVGEELSINICEAYEDYQQTETDWEQVRSEISELKGKIQRLGNVNVDAINEQEGLEERNEFLTNQIEDLNKSRSQLEQLIAKINKESRDKFQHTFNEVRENFQLIFRKLFGGGKADIMLEDPEDILECGIEILAKPPGKETRSISLLSGGEKTMTAIALLFSIFKTRPSPFCFLDEVDAALDEANNERFNLILKEFQEDSQFVVITHSKRTMSIADVLFGVTMQMQGVSKKISVKFDSPDSTESQVA